MSENKIPYDKDRRKHKRISDSFSVMYRVKSPFNVVLQLGDRDHDAIAEDISQGGIGLHSNHEIPAKTLVNLKFRMLNDTSSSHTERQRDFDINGEVRYGVPVKGGHRIGVLFLSITDADRNFIATYIRDQGLASNA